MRLGVRLWVWVGEPGTVTVRMPVNSNLNGMSPSPVYSSQPSFLSLARRRFTDDEASCGVQVREVQLRGETLKMYDRKRKLGLAVPKLAQYCSMATFYTHAMRPPFISRLTDNPNSWASKIGA